MNRIYQFLLQNYFVDLFYNILTNKYTQNNHFFIIILFKLCNINSYKFHKLHCLTNYAKILVKSFLFNIFVII